MRVDFFNETGQSLRVFRTFSAVFAIEEIKTFILCVVMQFTTKYVATL